MDRSIFTKGSNEHFSRMMRSVTTTILSREAFAGKMNLTAKLSEIFSTIDVNIETHTLSNLKILSLTTGRYRCMLADIPIDENGDLGECEYQEYECNTLEQVCEHLTFSKEALPWFEKVVDTIKESTHRTLLIDGLQYTIKGELIGTEGDISLYHLFNGKWMWFNSLTGENDIADDFDFKHGKVQNILVRAGLREPISTFVFE